MSHTPQSPTEQQRAMEGPREVPAGAHFGALMAKNIKLKLRQPVTTCVEAFIPLLFVLGLVLIWAISASSEIPAFNMVPDTPTMPVLRPWTELQRYACTNTSRGLTVPGLRACTAADVAAPNFKCISGSKVAVPNGLCVGGKPAEAVLKDSWFFNRPKAVPSFDEVVLFKWIADSELSWLERFNFVTRFQSSVQGSGVIFADETGQGVAQRFGDYLNATTGTFGHVFRGPIETTESAALGRNTVKSEAGFAMVVITFYKLDADGVHVTFWQNRSGSPTTAITFDKFGSQGLGFQAVQNWHTGGLLTMQQALQEYFHTQILGQTTASQGNASSAMRETVTVPTPYVSYVNNGFYIAVGDSISLIVTLAFLFPVSQLTKRVVLEKELRLREAMMIMGLSNISFYASWFLTYLVQAVVSSLLIAIVSAITMLPKADFGVIFFLFLLFSVSTIGISFMLSAVFSLSRTAALLAPALFFVMSVPSFALSADAPAGVMVPLSLLSPVAFGACARLLFSYEVTDGLSAKNLNSELDEVPAITYLVMLGIDIILYILIALYLDNVIPSQWGTRKHPLFFIIDPIRWCLGSDEKERQEAEARERELQSLPDAEGADSAAGSLFEPTSARDQEPTVKIQRLRKEFGDFVAVKELDLPMYEGEVSVLLGHNGAGKTTTIGCMMGMLGTDGGDVNVYGDSVAHELAAARQHMGFCPQHNILWDEMTCIEHLEFFARLKGIPSGPEATALAEEMLDAVDLTPKRDFPSSALSGGQKRKLSVAMAFVGGSKMVFLDEPTAGMDVAARRHTWELIRKMKAGRTILLTTHFMDEADLLGDTVAIMAHGVLKCSGSSVFLKSRLGVGYTLTVANEGDAEIARRVMDNVILPKIPTAERLGETGGGELTVRLPMDEAPKFPDLLAALESNPDTKSFGIGLTTLEEVFLKIGVDAKDGNDQGGVTIDDDVMTRVRGSADKPLWETQELGDRDAPTPGSVQFGPLMMKRLRSSKRDTRVIILQVILPVVCIFIALLLANIEFFQDTPRLELTGSAIGGIGTDLPTAGCPATEFTNYAPGTTQAFAVPGLTPAGRAGGLSKYMLDNFNNHERFRLGAISCNAPETNSTTGVALIMTNESFPHATPITLNEYHAMAGRRAAGRPIQWDIGLNMMPLSFFAKAFVEGLNAFIFGLLSLIPFTFIPSTFVAWIVKEREHKSKHLQLVSGLHYGMYWASNYLFDMVSFIVTMLLALLLFLIFDREEFVGTWDAFGAIFLLLFLFGLSAIAGSYLLSFAFDHHATAQNVVMFINFVVGFFLVVILQFLSFQPSTEGVAKALKYVFRIHPAYCLGDGMINLASLSLVEVFTADTKGPFAMDVTGTNLVYMAIEVPVYLGLVFLLDHPSRELKQQQLIDAGDEDPETDMVAAEDDDVHTERLVVENGEREHDVVSVKNLRKVYTLASRPKEDKEQEHTHDDGNDAEHDDGNKKKKKSTEAPPTNIKGNHLVAVRNLSFGVQDHEVFGFLGTNGAGKTTTMNILTGAFPPTAGHATVMGHDCTSDAVGARRHIGYCPQFDALSDLLTPPEHIELYAGLRGIPATSIPKVVDVLLTLCELNEYRETVASSLSGGNKRKLSVAIALIGGPRVVFLDEPSAGMDPVARRGLWTAIQRIVKQCAVVLTTHHLEEVEALAHRVAIMVDGEMRILGSLGHLKHKFGSGFELVVRVVDAQHEKTAQELIDTKIPGATLEEARGQKLTYALPGDTMLSRIFAVIEEAKQSEDSGITDYGISQTSVEQIFLRAKQGPVPEAEQ